MNSLRLLALAPVLALLANVGHGGVVYVNHAAVGANNGTSWADAFTDLRAGLTGAVPGDEVWVARGTYSPAGGTPTRADSFVVSGVGLFGGFTGAETAREQRSWAANQTILTGDLGGGLHAYHVLRVFNNTPLQLTSVDGFVVAQGEARGAGLDGYGGGAILYPGTANVVVVSNCRFLANEADTGGALYLGHASADIVNCVFASNHANTAGAMYCPVNFNEIMNCTFYGNASQSIGNAIYAETGVYGDVAQCIAWGCGLTPMRFQGVGFPIAFRCCVEGGLIGDNISSDPLFVNAPGRDFRLSPGSPCIDAGWAELFANLWTVPLTDLAGRPRSIDDPSTPDAIPVFSSQPDIGAYEFLPDCDGNGIVDLDDVSTGAGSDFNQDTVLDACQPAGSYFCFGDGSGAACPCGNQSPTGSGCGCLNATGGAGKLEAFGLARVGHDSVVLHTSGLGSSSPALYFQGDGLDLVGGSNGLPFGDGLRCVFGAIVRLGTRTSVAGTSTFGAGIAGDPSISTRGQVPATGGTRYYQVWYRSALPFCMPDTFNATNAVELAWGP